MSAAAVSSPLASVREVKVGSRNEPKLEAQEKEVYANQADAPPCMECGSIMVRNGACYKCVNCGATSGCS